MLSSVTNLLHFKTCKTNVLLNHVITHHVITGSLCVIVLETTEEKSWINSFDLLAPPPPLPHFNFDCGQT